MRVARRRRKLTELPPADDVPRSNCSVSLTRGGAVLPAQLMRIGGTEAG